ncbi:MAG TPA: methionine synthase [Negativicutes bacterium]|nr:methionine synthase [Negativicutes bacterium]
MQTFNPPLLKIDKEEARRYAGLRTETVFPEHVLDAACAEALLLVRPQAVWKIYPYAPSDGLVAGPTPLRLTGRTIHSHLAGAGEAAVLAVTIGSALEEEVSRLFAAGQYTAGLLLDAAGTAAVEQAADAADAFIADQAARRGLAPRRRFSPGYGDWPITDQPAMVALACGGQINLSVTASCMLVPRKSVTAIIGLGPAGRQAGTACKKAGCAACPQTDCIARKELPQ